MFTLPSRPSHSTTEPSSSSHTVPSTQDGLYNSDEEDPNWGQEISVLRSQEQLHGEDQEEEAELEPVCNVFATT
jgi:hypothetical protein